MLTSLPSHRCIAAAAAQAARCASRTVAAPPPSSNATAEMPFLIYFELVVMFHQRVGFHLSSCRVASRRFDDVDVVALSSLYCRRRRASRQMRLPNRCRATAIFQRRCRDAFFDLF
jgi:hypothetical protein